jgi:hypothetical protein
MSEILSKIHTDLLVKYPLFLSDFNEQRIFLTDLGNAQISNFMKIRPVGVGSMWTGGRIDGEINRWTDIYDEANSSFPQFSSAPKNCLVLIQVNTVAGRSLAHL